jgi:hypothetical protein
MLTYFISGSNGYTFRTNETTSSAFTMSLQDMLTQTNSTASITSASYNQYESMLAFTASINGVYVGQEFRATLLTGTTELWNGSVQVFGSQSVVKPEYINQIPLNSGSISSDSSNEYIIMN